MAERRGSRDNRDLVFCHSCENEWFQDEHGLQCPRCQSEIVEIIEDNNDPRHPPAEDFPNIPPSPSLSPLHGHDPWDHQHDTEDPGDPEEGDINHVEWHRGNMHFQSTTYRSPTIRLGGPGGRGQPDMFSIVSQIMGTLGGPAMQGRPPPGSPQRQPGPPGQNGSPSRGGIRIGITGPLQEGPSRQGITHTFTTTGDPQNRGGGSGPQALAFPFEELQGLLSAFLGPDSPPGPGGPGGPGGTGFRALFARLLDPTNAQHGDAVYSQEALDHVITQLMDQHRGSTAPGPASPAAIAALPKVPVVKSMLGDNGKAECSVCMDSVNVGDEVTMLPCTHWFHGECVGAWLNEHDTCPHCRQSITPKEGNREEPRSPEQAPLHSPTWPLPSSRRGSASQQQRGNQSPRGSMYRQGNVTPAEANQQRRASTSSSQGRRNSGENGGSAPGRLAGWFSRRMGGGGGSGH